MTASGVPDRRTIERWVARRVAEVAGMREEDVDRTVPLAAYGLGSVEAVALAGELERWLGIEIPDILAWEAPTLDALSRSLRDRLAGGSGLAAKRAAPAAPVPAGGRPASPIALVGIGCRFPGGADDPASLWRLLAAGSDQVEAASVGPRSRGARAALLTSVDGFDAGFFGISPPEARGMDPQQRLVLEVAWEALEHAGIPEARLRDARTGVFVGVYQSDYLLLQVAEGAPIDVFTASGNAHSVIANRLSYTFDLSGPSLAVDTACSSSLVATHLACQSLRAGECDLALVAGVNLILSEFSSVATERTLTLGAGGRCRAFDANADGIVRAEGCGVVVLERKEDADRTGDRIVALVRGSAVNQDGRTNGLTAPSPRAQVRVMEDALAGAGVDPAEVDYVEAHGTGTPLGDPIETQALARVYGRAPGRTRPCAVGSVKTNIGHAEASAGIAGLIKAALVVERGIVPPNVHLRRPNPALDLAEGSLLLASEPVRLEGPWPRRAGVSSFSFGGTNAHVVLEQASERGAPPPSGPEEGDRHRVIPVSARSPSALEALALRYAEALRGAQLSKRLDGFCHTAAVRRTHHRHRLAVHGVSAAALAAGLERAARRRTEPGGAEGGALVFAFPGQGSQWPGMGVELARREPAFREELERCHERILDLAGWSLRDALSAPEPESPLGGTAVCQLAVFSVQASLLALFRSWGLGPDAVVGHSLGEVTAAYAAGVLDLEDALLLLHRRGRLLEGLPGGAMTSVALGEEDARTVLEGVGRRIWIAAVNGPTSVSLAGRPDAVAEVESILSERGVSIQRLPVDRAFHGPDLAGLRDAFTGALEGLEFRPPSVPLYSSVEGRRIDGGVMGPGHWFRNLADPVLFGRASDALVADAPGAVVDLGPHPALAGYLSRAARASGKRCQVLPTLRRGREQVPAVLGTLARLYELGWDPRWDRIHPPSPPVDLPRYPWQRRRYWFRDEDEGSVEEAPESPTADPGRTAGGEGELRRRVRSDPTRAEELLMAFLTRQLAELGVPETPNGADLDPGLPVGALGVESLVLVQLKNAVEEELGVSLPLPLLTGDTTLRDVGALIRLQLDSPLPPARMSPAAAHALLGRVEDLSDAEVSAALGRLLPEDGG